MHEAAKWNIALIGEPHVGKSTIASRLVNERVSDDYCPTIGASMVKVFYQKNGTVTWFYLWDTAGMEKYRSLAPIFYRDSRAAIIVYDVCDRESFNKLDMWRTLYQENVGISNPILIVGNKIDLPVPSVSADEARLWAEGHQCEFTEVSAKTEKNLESILSKLGEMVERSSLVPSIKDDHALEREKLTGECC
jgi:small GTP-binding protein